MADLEGPGGGREAGVGLEDESGGGAGPVVVVLREDFIRFSPPLAVSVNAVGTVEGGGGTGASERPGPLAGGARLG